MRSIAPLDARPIPFGDSARLAERDPVMIVNHGGPDDVTLALVASRRQFTGNWEYLLDQAIFTTPPTLNWSGAALVDRDGRLLGVGSLIVREALAGDERLPGNMFVPIDALKPILEDLVKTGRRAGPPRPWLGVSADEQQGRLFVSRVSPDGPGDKAGIQVGDIILARRRRGRAHAGRVLPQGLEPGPRRHRHSAARAAGRRREGTAVHSIDRVEYFQPGPPSDE